MEGFGLLRRFFCALLALTLCILFAAPARGEGVSDFIRLHVVASGDTDWEQAVKLAVRDACLEKAREVAAALAYTNRTLGFVNAPGLLQKAALNADLAAFQSAATIAAREMGFDGAVTVETGAFAFPDRVYGALLVPAGDYRALRVTLGEGGGHNWWCVLYPSLCVVDEAAYYAGEDVPIEFYSSVGRFLRGLFGG